MPKMDACNEPIEVNNEKNKAPVSSLNFAAADLPSVGKFFFALL